MKRTWRKFSILLSVFYADMMQYRAELYLWALSGLMPFILMGLWVKASADGEFAMSSVEFARYFFAVFFVRQITIVWVVWEVEHDVITGRLSHLLLQPLDPVWRYFLSHSSERLARLPFLLVLSGVFFWLYPAALWRPTLGSLAMAAVSMVLAYLLRFIMQFAFGMLAFWTERANAIEDLWFLAYLFLSGFLAPLDVFPPVVRQVAMLTPFPYLVYMPARLLTGAPVDLLGGFTVMAVWGAVFIGLYRLLWRLGLRQYSGMGA